MYGDPGIAARMPLIDQRGYSMFEGIKESLFAEQLRNALYAYQEASQRLAQVQAEVDDRESLVRILLAALKLQRGTVEMGILFDRFQLGRLVRPFLESERPSNSKVIRRRGEDRRIVSAHRNVTAVDALARGTPVRMRSGSYAGYQGTVSSLQTRMGRKGPDVMYFLSLQGPKGDRKRTSVKGGTLNKSWEVIAS